MNVSSASAPLPPGSRMIEGYFKCPTAFAVMASVLDREYVVDVGGQRVTLTFPSASAVDMFRTDLQAPDWFYRGHDDSLSERSELAPFWGRIAIAGPDSGAGPKAVTVTRFRVATVTFGDDDRVREVGCQVAEGLTGWWDSVSSWIEILYGQDLSRLGPTRAGVHFHEATLWAELFSVQGHALPAGGLLPVGSGAIEIVYPDFAPVDGDEFGRCIAVAEQLGMPRTEWLLIRDATSLCAGRDYRRAVLDAGLAAELAVTQLISDYLADRGLDINAIRAILDRHRMLGERCRYWEEECGGDLPDDFRARLITRRNEATHAGRVPQESDVRDAIGAARELVARAFPVPV